MYINNYTFNFGFVINFHIYEYVLYKNIVLKLG